MPAIPRPLRALLLLPALGALGACASGGASSGTRGTPGASAGAAGSAAGGRAEARATGRSSNIISAADIAESRSATALEVVERLRPNFLRSQNARFPVQVYVNGVPRGGAASLRQLRADDVQSIRRLSAAEAQMRYGPDLLSGVIEVEMKPGRG